ncbi:hypothetical protein [Sphingomonas melonis]|uniref:hypothetical protein n=1 Tax=Sphingomonas melonis TaxID=152682 RepID=UPI0036D89A10
MIAQIATAWFAASIATGLLIGRSIPPTTDDRQHGEGERVRGDVQSHNGVNN